MVVSRKVREGRLDEAPLSSSRLYLEAAAIAEIVVSSSAAEAITATTGTGFLWLGFVHGQGSAVHLRAVQRRDGSLGFLGRAHFDEAEAPRLSREFVHDYTRRFHGAVCRKQGGEL